MLTTSSSSIHESLRVGRGSLHLGNGNGTSAVAPTLFDCSDLPMSWRFCLHPTQTTPKSRARSKRKKMSATLVLRQYTWAAVSPFTENSAASTQSESEKS